MPRVIYLAYGIIPLALYFFIVFLLLAFGMEAPNQSEKVD